MENIYIIRAADSDEAYQRADAIGLSNQSDDSAGVTLDGKPAKIVYAGVRRLAEIIDCYDSDPEDGDEVAWLSYTIRDTEELDKLLKGRAARVIIEYPDYPADG